MNRRAICLAALFALAACRQAETTVPLAAAPASAPVARNVLLRQAVDALKSAQRDGDVALHVRADRLATELIERDGPDAVTLTLRAAARAGQHRFDEAVTWADQAIALNPDDPAPYGVLIDALVEIGKYDRAVDTAQFLLDLKPTYMAYARAAYLRALYGDQAGGLRLMQLAIDACPSNAPAERAWLLTHLGQDALAAGDSGIAAHAFAEALALRPADGRALQGLAALAVARGEIDAAIDLYQRAAAGAVAADAQSALADLYLASGRPSDAARAATAAEQAARLLLESPGRPEGRQLALLYADRGTNLDTALHLAEQAAAWRDDVYTNDTLAWVLYRSGRIDEARQTSQRALRLGSRDPVLLQHGALIAAAAGDADTAARLIGAHPSAGAGRVAPAGAAGRCRHYGRARRRPRRRGRAYAIGECSGQLPRGRAELIARIRPRTYARAAQRCR
ncbi:MAG: tetratricopeptide repeat protein [bacterium]